MQSAIVAPLPIHCQYRRPQCRLGRYGNSISVQTSEIKKKAVDAPAAERIEESRKAALCWVYPSMCVRNARVCMCTRG